MVIKKLSDKQKRFVQEYTVDCNGTQAAIRAGYSKRTANEQATRLLAKVHIQVALKKELDKQQERTRITADEVLKELANNAFFNIKDLYDDEGNLKDIKDLDDKTARAISAIEFENAAVVSPDGKITSVLYVKRIKTNDKTKNLELLGKHLKMFTDVTEIREQKIEVTLTEIR